MQNELQDAVKHAPSGGTYTSEGTFPAVGAAVVGAEAGGGGAQAGNGVTILTPTEGVDFKSYINRLLAKLKQNWVAVMPESFYLGDKGIVAISFRINRDGTFPQREASALIALLAKSRSIPPRLPRFEPPAPSSRFRRNSKARSSICASVSTTTFDPTAPPSSARRAPPSFANP